MSSSRDPDRPWTWSWFTWLPGEGITLAWIVLIHVTSIVGLVLYPWPGLTIALAAYALYFLGGLGTTVAYHRALAHKALHLHPAVECLLVAFAIFNGSGTPATWSANHRNHHANADTVRDISSPRIGGFWWSHLRWLWQASCSPVDRWAPDLNTPYWRFWTRAQVPILALSFFGGLLISPAAFFWLGAIRLTVSLHAQCFVNSLAHMKKGVAPGEDSSQNLASLGLIHSFQGENWHQNHHAEPNSARLGRGWAQIDLGWVLIVTLEKLGLATKVRRPN
ncbi:MAG: hypothetical protein IPH13_08720 [Planctomycetes bacterium]|nr:hypothetical protein [Planctomycetota bacterium]